MFDTTACSDQRSKGGTRLPVFNVSCVEELRERERERRSEGEGARGGLDLDLVPGAENRALSRKCRDICQKTLLQLSVRVIQQAESAFKNQTH